MNELTITRNGKLLPFNYTINLSKSNIPLMPEAVDVTQTVPGVDGDIVLDTTYGARGFEIVAVTDDGLSPQEKEEERERIREFLHSIKNTNVKLIIEELDRAYTVKYTGLAEANNMPMSIEFVLPLKSSNAYAISNHTYSHTGVSSFNSKTIVPTGCKIMVTGPANPVTIMLNGEAMNYNYTVVSGHKLIIDTSNSTVVDYSINSGAKTNVMAYFNHVFPKIKNGTNTLSITGVDASNLEIEWNDLLL